MGCLRLNYSEKQNSRGLTLYEFDVVGMRHQTVNSGISGMNYVGTDYFFEKNILGDVVGIYNAQTGAHVGGYSYDAWGNHLSVRDGNGNDVLTQSSHIVNLNPFRYRGYYYDTDTNLYYLNTRYYDPETGRFLNPDKPENLFLEATQPFGANLYQYCYNNPIMLTDSSGQGPIWDWIKGAAKDVGKWVSDNWEIVVGTAVIVGLGIATVATGGAVGIVAGAFYGSLIGGGIGAGFGALTGAITGDWSNFGSSFMWGAIGGALSGGFAKIGFSSGNFAIAGKTANAWQIAGQMAMSTGVYVGKTLSSGQSLTFGGFAFSFLGGFGAGSGLEGNAARTVSGLLGLYGTISDVSRHYRLWISYLF